LSRRDFRIPFGYGDASEKPSFPVVICPKKTALSSSSAKALAIASLTTLSAFGASWRNSKLATVNAVKLVAVNWIKSKTGSEAVIAFPSDLKAAVGSVVNLPT
jgi:hypothetical protein